MILKTNKRKYWLNEINLSMTFQQSEKLISVPARRFPEGVR